MRYDFLVETYDTERLKTLSVWSMFRDEDLTYRPGDRRGRSVREQMVHQCVSEDLWFRNLFGIDVGAPPLPEDECRLAFMRRYDTDSQRRLEALRSRDDAWWETSVMFFEVARTRAWIFTRRLTHTAHHRGQQTSLLRALGRQLYSTYGPTADTGGLMQHKAPTIYPYDSCAALLAGEAAGGAKAPLPEATEQACTERPGE